MSKILRCAVYTRKSTDEGLEQDFNSLDAQREACEAYIRSQIALGWKLSPKKYDDGGVSGGTMDRPALQQLLSDIKAKQVDVVVVYKIDRLTRSLMDFSKIVEIFDTSGVSFVSVTQQFNTTTSMGRLTLNVLLSFAQFEREVTAERIRDKIAASKKKGMWMGGPVPLGYDLRDRRLYINEADAETVRRLFRLYLEIGGVRALKVEADRLGIITKQRHQQNGKVTGGRPFTRGNLYRLLSNRIYLGQIEHHGTTYQGQHDAIVDQDLWDGIQQQLKSGAVARGRPHNSESIHLLTGLVFDETGDRLSPTYATKGGKRYRYYASNRLLQAHRNENDGWRIPAQTLENAALQGLTHFLNDPGQCLDLTQISKISPANIKVFHRACADLVRSVSNATLIDQRTRLQQLITRMDLHSGEIAFEISQTALLRLIGVAGQGLLEKHPASRAPIMLRLPFALKRRGIEAKIVLGGDNQKLVAVDPALVGLIAKAHRWLDLIASGTVSTLEDLARAENADASDVSRILPLAFLAPETVEAAIEGRNPIGLTLMKLKRLSHLPHDWCEQQKALV
jgi:DNA invertase Pin-like site-specific DNA recombinase